VKDGLAYLWINVIGTLLRVLPLPCRTGLVPLGNPGRDAPVLLTCNFRLTVERLKRVVRGTDAWLLVANSRGVNVWCAATGGLLTDHDVIAAVKTTGIEERVDHRRLILPQLAATGVEAKLIQQRTGWHIVWGPVRAQDIPAFLAGGREASRTMRTVSFPWRDRAEMAVAWAFPISLLGGLLALPFLGRSAAGLVTLVWALSLALFLAFPLYESRVRRSGRNRGFVFFDFGRTGLPLIAWGVLVAGLVVYAAVSNAVDSGFVLRWAFGSLVILLILSLDLTGSTPTFKSGLHEDRLLRIELDEERCKGAGFCEQVCPTAVFEIDAERRLATLPNAGHCVQCGACIVQCPFDALYFRRPSGASIPPESVRRFKLNLMGTRARRSGSAVGSDAV
jgi:NAD-dependent dihydropyrimidine dehydrogenase PreA subunit